MEVIGGDLAQHEDRGFSLGLRSANDQSLSIRIAIGERVFVCDNLAFDGDLIALKRKHTTGLDLRSELDDAVQRYLAGTRKLDALVNAAREVRINEVEAKARILDTFVTARAMPIRLLPDVTRTYFEPTEDMTDILQYRGTLWSLHNAFTRVARVLAPRPRFEATARLGRLLANLN